MRAMLWVCAAAAAACQAPPPGKPSKALDAQDPRSVLEHAVYNTRTQQGYETAFEARLQVPNGAPIDYRGECVWNAPGILFVHYTATGGDDKKIVRVAGKEGWVWHPVVEDWVTADEAGIAGAGRGIQNPDDVLAALSRFAGAARLPEPGTLRLELAGPDLERVMDGQTQKGSFDWGKSTATLVLALDGDSRLKTFTCDAALVSTDPNVKGEVGYTARIDLKAYNGKTELEFKDEGGKPIGLAPDIQAAIAAARKENR